MSLKLAPSDYEIYIPIGEWIEGNIKEWLLYSSYSCSRVSSPMKSLS